MGRRMVSRRWRIYRESITTLRLMMASIPAIPRCRFTAARLPAKSVRAAFMARTRSRLTVSATWATKRWDISAPMICMPRRGRRQRKRPGGRLPTGPLSRAALSGPASTTKASRRRLAGRTSAQTSERWIPAGFQKTPITITSRFGAINRWCTSSRTGTGWGRKAGRLMSGSTAAPMLLSCC